jgi:hypothetical protein
MPRIFDETKQFVAGFISTKKNPSASSFSLRVGSVYPNKMLSISIHIFTICRAYRNAIWNQSSHENISPMEYICLVPVCICVSLSVTGFCLRIMNINILLLQAQWTNSSDMVTQNAHFVVFEVLMGVAMNGIILWFFMRCSPSRIHRRFGGNVLLATLGTLGKPGT